MDYLEINRQSWDQCTGTHITSKFYDIVEWGTYTENCDDTKTKTATWAHALSDVMNALINAGIQIDQFNEFPFSPYDCFDRLEEREPGRFYVSGARRDIPLVYSIRGTATG